MAVNTPWIEWAAEFVAARFVEAGIIRQEGARDRIYQRLQSCSQVFIDRQAVAGVIVSGEAASITCLASRNPHSTLRILYRLGRYCVRNGIKHIMADIHPDHAYFYTGIGAEIVEGEHPIGYVDNAVGVTILIDLESNAIRSDKRWQRHVFGEER